MDEDLEKVREAVELVKKVSDGLTDKKKEGQRLRGALKTIESAGQDYLHYNYMYNDLLATYTNYWLTLRALSDILHLTIVEDIKLEELDQAHHYLYVTIDGEEHEIELTEEQFLSMKKSNFISNPSIYKRKNKKKASQ